MGKAGVGGSFELHGFRLKSVSLRAYFSRSWATRFHLREEEIFSDLRTRRSFRGVDLTKIIVFAIPHRSADELRAISAITMIVLPFLDPHWYLFCPVMFSGAF